MLDFVFDGNGDPDPVTAYLPGISQTDVAGEDTYYLHADHLGSTWYTSTKPSSTFIVSSNAIRTAFGETVQGHSTPTRYGYAGAWGYQEHDHAGGGPGTPDGQPDSKLKTSPTAGFPYMHVGHRYYDPGSGRFLQRDPIGIDGGLNVYEYVGSSPLMWVDPSGMSEGSPWVLSPIQIIEYIEAEIALLIFGGAGATVGEAMMFVTGTPLYSDYEMGTLYCAIGRAMKEVHNHYFPPGPPAPPAPVRPPRSPYGPRTKVPMIPGFPGSPTTEI